MRRQHISVIHPKNDNRCRKIRLFFCNDQHKDKYCILSNATCAIHLLIGSAFGEGIDWMRRNIPA